MAKKQLPTLKEIRAWAVVKGWEIKKAYSGMCCLRREIRLTRRGEPFVITTDWEGLGRFRALCGHLMDENKWKWRDKK